MTEVEKLVSETTHALFASDPNRVLEVRDIAEDTVDDMRTRLNSSDSEEKYDVKYIFLSKHPDYGVAHIRRVK